MAGCRRGRRRLDDKLHEALRGNELPSSVADKEKRLAKIRAAKVELAAQAKAAAQEERRRRAEAEEKRIAQGRKKNGFAPKPPSAEPVGKAQRNFTDPESRLLLTKDGYIQGWNAKPLSTALRRSCRTWPDAQHERPRSARGAW